MSAGIVVAGGGLVAQRACERLRRRGWDGPLTVVSDEAVRPYDRPPLSKGVLAGTVSEDELFFRAEDWYEDRAIELVLAHRAIALDPESKRLHLDAGEAIPYGQLLIATGAAPRTLPGTEGFDNVYTLRSAPDAAALRRALVSGASLVIIGAGFVGLEVAATARALGCEVTLIEAAPAPLAGVIGAELGAWFAELHRQEGVQVLTGQTVSAFHGRESVEAVEMADGRRIPATAVLIGVGVRPDAQWVAGSGLDPGGIRVDEAGRTGLPGIFAAGDVTVPVDSATGRPLPSGHWEASARAGWSAADSMLGLPASPGPLPSFWSDQYGLRIQSLGRTGEADRIELEGDPAARDFAVRFTRDGRQIAALLVGRPHALPEHRRRIELPPSQQPNDERKAA